MLVLTRKARQEICIGDKIRVEVLEIRPGRVKLGFSCPPEVRVLRQEICPIPPAVSRLYTAKKLSECARPQSNGHER